jgi:hypothetical protein
VVGNSRTWAARPAAALGVVAAIVQAGCGELSTEKGLHRVTPAVVSRDEVARARGPERAVLAWLWAVQTRDARSAARAYDPALGVTADEVSRQLRAGRRFFDRIGFSAVQDVDRRGSRATVFCMLASRRAAPNGRLYVFRTPQAFELRRRGSTWWIADDLFLRFAGRRYVPAEKP